MNYKVLARKWRPQSFDQISGQKHIIQAINNSLLINKIHHAWLLYGIRGTGKTSIARILAKTLNCTNLTNIQACRICNNCINIENGTFLDLIEVDAASRTKIEDMKDLLNNIHYAPIKGKYKIYLIDEIHMLSKHSFNALLKNIEEPPDYIKFIFATTNIEKIPKTIISRCLQFNLKPISESEICKRIKKILIQENITFEENAIKHIAIFSEGSLRDGLSLTEHAIALGKGNISTNLVYEITGSISDQLAIQIVSALLNNNTELIINIFNEMNQNNIEWDQILSTILRILHHIAMIQSFPLMWKNTNINKIHNNILQNLIHTISPITIHKCYQELIIGKKELKFAPNAKIGVEMALLRLINLNKEK
ncbi:DNA polymerase III subunit tau, partial [isoform gamma] [Buchnera aphidicola (Eriosoma lanigerum)]|uniref:DNA polymerase III subunit gamma/tau n=1 Tax=Buchnera aphidicola TaxID=9 RepID=UPI003463CFF6